MRRIVHISDLHFGRVRKELLSPLVAAINDAAPDLVALSGDLTQRARDWQFAEARAFLARLKAPCLVVPGNHDIPLDNPLLRLARPWQRYRRWMGRELEPMHADEEIIVVGMNTADPFAWQRGKVRRRALDRVCRRFAGSDGRARILVAHHPFEQLPEEPKQPMPNAEAAIGRLAACGAHVVLSGHLHVWRAAPFSLPLGPGGVLQVQAGTGLSNRLREADNDFNLLTVTPGAVDVERFVPDRSSLAFARAAHLRFTRGEAGWQEAAPGAP